VIEINFRLAKPADLDAIDEVFASGRAFLREAGLSQWQNGYGPTRFVAEKDIVNGEGYVLIIAENVHGYAALTKGIDECYTAITGGAWDSSHATYVSVHRVAIHHRQRGQGLAKHLMDGLKTTAVALGFKDVRIDTHSGNTIMKKVIENAGFVYRGMVCFPIPNGERMAYQWLSAEGF
jgi:GNAT superfamily N-acetyltransferase